MAAGVTLEKVRKAYGEVQVVKGLDLQVGEGEFIALLGPSGCGKTTTLRMIAGLEACDGGRISIGAQVVNDGTSFVPPEHRGLGMVFQSYAIWPNKTVAENVAYPLQLLKVPKPAIAQRVAAALTQVRLDALGSRMPSALSGGQLQRVALARALVADPKVLLLDEPLSNLDATLREEMRAELASLRARLQTTMIYVTHDQGEALALADRVAVMNKGVLEQLAPPRELYAQPNTPFVAGFVGGANVLSGRVLAGALEVNGVALGLPPDADRTEGEASFAVRPEELRVDPLGVRLKISTALYLGATTELLLELGDQRLRARVDSQLSARPGESVPIAIARAHRFSRGI